MPETLSFEELSDLSNRALIRAGLSDADAATVTHVLVTGEGVGLPTHGVIRLISYIARLNGGGVDPNAVPSVDRRAPSLALVDGNNALGPVVATAAMNAALEMVAETGIAYVTCNNSNHIGPMVPYALDICRAGYLLFGGTGATSTMAPFGGAEARIGNNPICFAAPCPEEPHFILDMAISVAARGKIRQARDAGEQIPEGWAVGPDGQPTTDPVTALDGFLIGIGGPKGSGLSMTVEIFSSVMSGAAVMKDVRPWAKADEPQGLGHFMTLIDPARLLGKEAFADGMRKYVESYRSTKPADPENPVMIAGEREQTNLLAANRDGMVVNPDVLKQVRDLAGE